jgi:hypothetical protein
MITFLTVKLVINFFYETGLVDADIVTVITAFYIKEQIVINSHLNDRN